MDDIRGYHSAVLYLNKMYVIGGVIHKYKNSGEPLQFPSNKQYCSNSTILEYDIYLQTWNTCQVKGSPPGSLENTTVVLHENVIYLFGGWSGKQHLNCIYGLNLSTMNWSEIEVDGKIPTPRAGHTMNRLDEGRFFVFGGQGRKKLFENEFDLKSFVCSEKYLNDVYNNQSFVFNLKELKWRSIETLQESSVALKACVTPSPRAYHACTVTNGAVYLYGGRNTESGIFLNLNISFWFLC